MSGEASSGSQSGGIGFVGVLGIVFIVLKLCHVIAWSWWWVLSPIWISMALVLVIILIAVAVWALHEVVKAIVDKKKTRGE